MSERSDKSSSTEGSLLPFMNDRRFAIIVGLIVTLTVSGSIVAIISGPSTSQSSASEGLGLAGVPSSTTFLGTGLTNLNSGVAVQSPTTSAAGSFDVTLTTTATQTATISSTTSASAPFSSAVTASSRQSHSAASQQTTTSGRSIEFFSNVTLRVPTPSLVLDKASAVAYSLGGYVAYSFFTNYTALVVLRVPAENYQHALSQIESLGTLIGAVTNSNDVTVKYTDLNATLVSLKGEQASILRLLNQSSNVNSTLKIFSMLQQVNAQINEVQSEILQTKTLIDYATISVSLQKQSVVPPPPPPKPLSLKFTATPKTGMSPLSVTFNTVVKGGTAPYIVNYNFGDGSSARADALIHTFGQPGHYNVSVAATDSTGNVTESWTMVNVLNPPVTSSFGNFPAFVGGLFLSVIEGIIEVAVVVIPMVAVIGVVVIPLKRRFDASKKRIGTAAASTSSTST